MSREIAGGGDSLARGLKTQTFEMPKQCVPGCECPSCKPPEAVTAEFDIPDRVDNSHLFVEKRPSVVYKGEPLSDRVLVKRFVPDSTSVIVIPDAAKGKSDYGIIVNLSPETKLKFGAGTLVLFDKFAAAGQEIKLIDDNGKLEEFLILQECDILLKLTAVHQSEAGTCVQ